MSIKGFLFYVFIVSIVAIVFINTKNYITLIFLAPLLFIVFKKFDIRYVFVCIAVLGAFCLYKPNTKPIISDFNVENATYEVYEAKEKYSIIAKDNIRFLIYNNDYEFEENETISINGTIKEIEKDLELDVFEFEDYLIKKRVFYQIEYDDIESVSKNTRLSTKIKNAITSKLEDESYNMTMMLLFNDKSANIDVYNDLKEINAIHLFVVSGFHISFLFKLISLIFNKNKNIGNIIASVIAAFYVFLLNFSISATRALVSAIIIKFFSDYFDRSDAVAIPGLLFLIIEPLNVFNYSFIMTYIMASALCFGTSILNKENKIIQIISVSVLCFFVMAPIQLLLNNKINPISLITNIILNYVVMGIFILCIIGLPLSLLNGNLFGRIYDNFNAMVNKIANINSSITLGHVKPWMILLYYVVIIVIIIFIENKKYHLAIPGGLIVLSMFVLLYNRQYFDFNTKVTFMNVYQGDCCIIQDANGGGVMLIDTGGLTNYDIAKKKIIPYLEYHGIRKIDIVSISHDDYDHCGALECLQQYIKVDKIIKDEVDTINLGKITFTNLNIYQDLYDNDNDKSIVLYATICDKNFLFTGDISSNIEKKIISDNIDIDVDILKVAHHGSSTSSCKEFISVIKPEYGIISVAKNNKYGHPSQSVLDTLMDNDVKIYRTDENGSIRFVLNKDKISIETAK